MHLGKERLISKQLIRNSLEAIFGKEIRKAVIASKVKIVSFDLFDTLVIRNVPTPADVFELVQIRYRRIHPDKRFEVDFGTLRKNAEYLARKESIQNGKQEITLEEIYACMQEINEYTKKELLQIEIEAEYNVCQPNYEVKAFFEQLIKQGYSVIITSDMYLPETVIKDILKKCGYSSYEALYLSSKYGETKAAGTLFDRILSDFQIESSQLLHIGDHCRADYWIPKQKGIQTFLYRKVWKQPEFFKMLRGTKKHFSKEQQLQFQMLQRIMINAPAKRDQNEKIGYEILGPLLLGYTMWLKKEIGRSKAGSLVFLAREGALLKRAFETLYPNEVKTHYVNVSRLSVCRASAVNAASWEEFCRIFVSLMSGVESVGDFLELIGLAETDEEQLVQYRIKKSMCFDKLENQEELFAFIQSYGKSYFENQSELLKEYLEQNGFCEKNMAIADIGWSGTMQVFLQKILPDAELAGYYLAVCDLQKGSDYYNCKRNGYFCNAEQWERDGKMIRFSMSALETLFLGTEGTTLAYQRENGKAVPLMAEQENTKEGIEVMEAVQNAAIRFLEDCRSEKLLFFFEEIDKKIAGEACFRFLIFPKKETLAFYQQLSFVNGVNQNSFLPMHLLPFYLLHPVGLRQELETNISKVIWLKALCKIPLPYYRMLCFLTNNMGMKSSYRKKYFKE